MPPLIEVVMPTLNLCRPGLRSSLAAIVPRLALGQSSQYSTKLNQRTATNCIPQSVISDRRRVGLVLAVSLDSSSY
jgi:hypothetical protein